MQMILKLLESDTCIRGSPPFGKKKMSFSLGALLLKCAVVIFAVFLPDATLKGAVSVNVIHVGL